MGLSQRAIARLPVLLLALAGTVLSRPAMEAVSLAQLKSALPPRSPAGFTSDAVHASTSSGSSFVQTS